MLAGKKFIDDYMNNFFKIIKYLKHLTTIEPKF